MLTRLQTYFFFAAIIAIYIISGFIDVMDVDASQYASISREMLERGDYLHVTDRHTDYLDKPPLLFWLSALSFKFFGISNFAYKLPSLLFALLGIFSTYKLSKLLYSEKTGLLSALIFASCQAMFLITNDVRTDTILTGAIIFSIWNIAAFNQSKKFSSLVAGFTGIGIAMLTKGPIGLMAPAMAFGTHFMLRREWKSFFRWQWLVGILIVIVLLAPMLWGLYRQFDLHPEKGISGVRFYLWDQSFGRLTGDNPFVNAQKQKQPFSPLFFTHTFLWSFIPWSILFVFGYWEKVKNLFRSRFHLKENEEAITTGGFTLVFIAMSISDYKLPHYIFIVYPLAAIISAEFLLKTFEDGAKAKLQRFFFIIQVIIAALLWILIAVLCILSFPLTNIFIILCSLVLLGLYVYTWIKKTEMLQRLLFISLLSITGANFVLSAHVYPKLLAYQSNSAVGKFVQDHAIPDEQFVCYMAGGHSLDFYSRRIVPWISSPEVIKDKTRNGVVWIFTNDEGKKNIESADLAIDSVIAYPDYYVSNLSLPFLIPAEREKVLRRKYLIRVEAE